MVATSEEWDTVAKRGISVASHRGGSKDDLDNYRFVVLLSVIGIAMCVFLRRQKLRRSFPADTIGAFANIDQLKMHFSQLACWWKWPPKLERTLNMIGTSSWCSHFVDKAKA